MKIGVPEIFFIFRPWAFVWVPVEYIYHRLSGRDRKHRSKESREKASWKIRVPHRRCPSARGTPIQSGKEHAMLLDIQSNENKMAPSGERAEPGRAETQSDFFSIETEKKEHKRVNDILLGPLERPALEFFCKHMPKWVMPDHLTLLGVFAGLLIGFSYFMTTFDRNFLWLASFGLVLHWFGDSLDGSLARYRKIERPKYGYYVDHVVDAYVTTFICIGLGLSPFVDLNIALFDLVGYLLMSVMAYITSNVTGVFKISYSKFGPTEARVIVILANFYFYFGPNPVFDFSLFTMSLYNLIAAGAACILYLVFAIFTLKQIRELAKLEPAKKWSS